MKNMFFFFFCCAFLPCVLCARGPALGRDVPDEPCRRENADVTFDKHTRALEFYIVGLLEKDPQKRIDHLWNAVSLDPLRKLSVLQLVKDLPKVPAVRIKEINEKFAAMRRRYPADIFLALQHCNISKAAGVSPEKLIEITSPFISRTPAAEEQNDFRSLIFFYVDSLLSTQRPTIELPPAWNDDIICQDIAYFYYSVRYFRDRFTIADPFSGKMVKKYEKLIAGGKISKLNDFRKHLAVLQGGKARELVWQSCEKWYAAHRDPLSALMLIDSAAECGKIKRLDELLKMYPALSGDYCTQKRIRAYQVLGNNLRAYQEIANFSPKQDAASYRFNLAVRLRDPERIAQALAELEKLPGRSPTLINYERLLAAEVTGDLKLFRKAEKFFAGHIFKDHNLANAFGYVSAVLNTDLDRAEKLLSFALSKSPSNAAYLDSMAWVCYKKKQYRRAAEYIQKAFTCLDHSVSGAVIAGHAGDIYLALGERSKALGYYQLAQQLYLENKADNADCDPSLLKKKIASLTSGKTNE